MKITTPTETLISDVARAITADRQGRAPLDNGTLHLVRLEDGQIAEIWFHNFDGAAVADFWA